MRANPFSSKLSTSAALAACLIACSDSRSDDANGPKPDATPVVYQADYPAYNSVGDLYRRAELVVQARVVGSPVTQLLYPSHSPFDPASDPSAPVEDPSSLDGGGIVTTIFKAEIIRTFKGEAKQGQIIDIQELGGRYQNVEYIDAGAVPLKPGSMYVLFVHVSPGLPSSLVNPKQGQYLVDDAGNISAVGANSLQVTASELEKLAASP